MYFETEGSVSLSIICLMVESSVDKVCFDDIYKSVRIYFHHFLNEKFRLLPGHYRVNHGSGVFRIASDAVNTGGGVMGEMGDFFVDLIRMSCDNKKRMFFISLVKHLNYLGGSELKDNGIQCLVPASGMR